MAQSHHLQYMPEQAAFATVTRSVVAPNWPLLREADFSGTLANWRSAPAGLPAALPPLPPPGADLDRILAFAG